MHFIPVMSLCNAPPTLLSVVFTVTSTPDPGCMGGVVDGGLLSRRSGHPHPTSLSSIQPLLFPSAHHSSLNHCPARSLPRGRFSASDSRNPASKTFLERCLAFGRARALAKAVAGAHTGWETPLQWAPRSIGERAASSITPRGVWRGLAAAAVPPCPCC